jgi:transcriptional regulator with XRE-family HTH domain
MPKISREAGVGLIDSHVGMRLRQRRTDLRISLQELAALTGVCYQQIQKYENGVNRISASMLWLLGEALRVSPAYFFEGLTSKDQLPTAPPRIDPPRRPGMLDKVAAPGR